MKYNYVIIGDTSWSYFFFYDLMRLNNVYYLSSPTELLPGKVNLLFFRAAFSPKRSGLIRYLAFNFIKRRMLDIMFDNKKPICYVFMDRHHILYNNENFMSWIKQYHPCNKTVLYMLDLVSRNSFLNVQKANKDFDFIITYDKGDASKYGWAHLPTPFSKIEVQSLPGYNKDVYFCGYAKNRMKEIIQAYNLCSRLGYTCDFYIKDCPNSERVEAEGIHYDVEMTYYENIRHVVGAKCILEIMQKGAEGFTPRLWEAIMYDKHLITNNNVIANSEYYYEKGCHILSDSMNVSFEPVKYPQYIKESLSPFKLVSLLEETL